MGIISIKDLAIKAGLIAPYGADREGLSDFDYRQFAKLLVVECEKVVDGRFNYDTNETSIRPGDLTKHFKDL